MSAPTYRVTKVVYNEQGQEVATIGSLVGQTLAEVAALTQTDPSEIEWAIEEYGKFEVMTDSTGAFDWRVTEE